LRPEYVSSRTFYTTRQVEAAVPTPQKRHRQNYQEAFIETLYMVDQDEPVSVYIHPERRRSNRLVTFT
jgi:hypothetical protein